MVICWRCTKANNNEEKLVLMIIFYDYNKLRIKKKTASEEIEYVRDGKRVLKEIHTIYNSSIIEGNFINSNIEAISSQGDVITYNYSVSGIEGFTFFGGLG